MSIYSLDDSCSIIINNKIELLFFCLIFFQCYFFFQAAQCFSTVTHNTTQHEAVFTEGIVTSSNK